MNIKVQNLNLELKIDEYESNGNKLANFLSEKELGFVDTTNTLPYMVRSDIISGMELSSYLDKVIIGVGHFYDEETNTLVKFDKPTTVEVLLEENQDYEVYYSFNTNTLVLNLPSGRYKKIGSFKVLNNSIQEVYPQKDLSDFYENGFIVQEQLGTIGYRIYSDGWKEQWGNNANPTFPIAFTNIPYRYTASATNVTKTGMTITAGYWYAEGY